MVGLRAYQRQQTGSGWTRIDLLLALYDGAIDRLEAALRALAQDQDSAAQPLLRRVELIVAGMVAGTNPEGDDSSQNLLRLYDYVIRCLRAAGPRELHSALSVLRTLREGFQGIREEALRLERTGAVPPVNSALLRECCA